MCNYLFLREEAWVGLAITSSLVSGVTLTNPSRMVKNTKKGIGNKRGHTVTPFENQLFRLSE